MKFKHWLENIDCDFYMPEFWFWECRSETVDRRRYLLFIFVSFFDIHNIYVHESYMILKHLCYNRWVFLNICIWKYCDTGFTYRRESILKWRYKSHSILFVKMMCIFCAVGGDVISSILCCLINQIVSVLLVRVGRPFLSSKD